MNKFNSNLSFIIAIVCAVWFMFTSWFWTYGVNLVVAYPFGLLSYLFWVNRRKKDPNPKRYKLVAIALIIGLVSSIGTLIGLLLYN